MCQPAAWRLVWGRVHGRGLSCTLPGSRMTVERSAAFHARATAWKQLGDPRSTVRQAGEGAAQCPRAVREDPNPARLAPPGTQNLSKSSASTHRVAPRCKPPAAAQAGPLQLDTWPPFRQAHLWLRGPKRAPSAQKRINTCKILVGGVGQPAKQRTLVFVQILPLASTARLTVLARGSVWILVLWSS